MAPKRFPFLSLFVIFLLCGACTAKVALYSGQRLSAGESLIQGSYILTMQADCNLVLYAPTAIWSSGTFGKGTRCYATLTYNGNLRVFSGTNVRLWTSGLPLSLANYVLILQSDRNLVIYGPARWSTRTNIPASDVGPVAINATVEVDGVQKKP